MGALTRLGGDREKICGKGSSGLKAGLGIVKRKGGRDNGTRDSRNVEAGGRGEEKGRLLNSDVLL